jgi:predicted enzyme related to lactoylglutathione lyase
MAHTLRTSYYCNFIIKKEPIMSNIVWFEIPVDDVERAKSFYGALFGWKIEKFPGPIEYWHIDTGGSDDSPDGGLLKRQNPQQQGITNYVGVTSVDQSAAKVEKLGGKICMPKTAVPQMGYFVICQDPENNTFALWENDDSAK